MDDAKLYSKWLTENDSLRKKLRLSWLSSLTDETFQDYKILRKQTH